MHPADQSIFKIAWNRWAGVRARQHPARLGGLIWLALGICLSTMTGFSATITWGSATTISGDTDVTNSGTLLYAYTGGTGATVNGIIFTAGNSGNTWGSISLSGFGNDNTTAFGSGSNVSPWSGLSSAYRNVLAGAAYGGSSAGTVTLNGLTSGHSYTLQIWVNDNRGGGETTRSETANGGGNTVTLAYQANQASGGGGVGQYVIGAFVATGTSQSFTLTPSAAGSAQLNAIQVRDTGVYIFTPTPFSTTRVDLAKYQPVVTDTASGSQTGSYITDGLLNNSDYWQSGPSAPHWAEVTFPFPVTVGSAQLALGLNNASAPTIFHLEYLTNSTWLAVPGTSVANNTNTERNLVFTSPITASAFRFYDPLDGTAYMRELALYPPNGASGFPFGTDFSIDLARKQPAFGTANTSGNWPLLAADGRVNSASTWETTLAGSNSLLINLQFTNKIGSAHLYSGAAGVAPLADFVLQYWNGGAWQNIPGGSVSGNSSGALVIPFTTPVTTTKVQLLFTNAGTSAVQELCVFPANQNGGYPLGTGVTTNPPVTAQFDTYTDSYFYISNAVAGQVVVESNGLPVLGTVPGYTWANQMIAWPSQYQVLLNYDNGSYRLINRNSGLCLAGAQMTTNVGAALVEEIYTALPDQEWFLETADGVNLYLVNQFSGLVMANGGGKLVQNILSTKSTAQVWQLPLAQIFPKKGIAGGWGNRPVQFRANWSYSWGLGVASNPGWNFYPQDVNGWWARGNSVAGNLLSYYTGWRTAAYSLYVLGYNEPDINTPGNYELQDPTNAAISWMNDQNLDLPTALPAAGNVNGTWNPVFLNYIKNWGCRTEYLPAHEYANPVSGSSDIWVSPLQSAYNSFGIPMWMTEFQAYDWGSTNSSWSEEDEYTALAEFLWRAESIPWLRKYSFFTSQCTNFAAQSAPNPWTRTSPGADDFTTDEHGNFTFFGELYAAWDDDANVETNKVYFTFNAGTRKRLRNSSGPAADATNIRTNDATVKWTLQPAGVNLYYLVSTLDGRKLSYTSGGSVSLVSSNAATTAEQWSLTLYRYGWFYLNHPATGLRLSLTYNNSTQVAAYSMVAQTITSTAVQWSFIATLPPPVWTGYGSNTWTTASSWSSYQCPVFGHSVTFNNLSTSNLNTVLAGDFNIVGISFQNPAGPVSIGGTNTLTVGGGGIELSAASQNLTITAPVFMGVNQTGAGPQCWTVTNTRTLSVNGRVAGLADLFISGGGTVSLGGTNTYTGNTTINAATLSISGAGQLGGGSYAANIADNGTFNYNSSASQTLSGFVSGTGSLTVNGPGTLILAGTNTYTGNTTVNGGTLALGNSIVSTNITVAGGATLDVSGLTTPFALDGIATLGNSSVGAVISGNNNCRAGTLSLVTDGVNASFFQANGTMTISTGTEIGVNNTGATLTPGVHPLILAATAGNPGRVTGSLPSVVVTGNGATGPASLQLDDAGNLNLVVATSSNPPSVNFTPGIGSLTLTWPEDHLGWIAQSNAVDLANSNFWFDILGSQSGTNLIIPINPSSPQVFYRLRYPY